MRERQKWKREHPHKLTGAQKRDYDLSLATMILGQGVMELFDDPEIVWLDDGGMRVTDRSGHFEAGSRIRFRVMGENGQWYPPDHEVYDITEEELAMVREAVHVPLEEMLAEE